MATKSKLVVHRAPETRQILSSIKGRALNWMNTVLALLFIAALYGASQVRFDTLRQVQANFRSDGTYGLPADYSGPLGTDLVAQIGSEKIALQPISQSEQVILIPRQPLPANPPATLSLVYEDQVHLLQAIFKGLW